MKLLVKMPTRGRAEKTVQLLDKYIQLASGRYDIAFAISLDRDDPQSERFQDMVVNKNNNDKGIKVYTHVGFSKSKVDAINRDLNKYTDFDVLLATADDMTPIEKNYDEIIMYHMMQNFPDGDGVLWFNDGRRQDLNTLPILGRQYFNRFNYIYHPSYLTEFCDNEFMEVAEGMNRQVFIDRVIIRHDHPSFTDKKFDTTYKKNLDTKLISKDKENYERRKKENFPK